MADLKKLFPPSVEIEADGENVSDNLIRRTKRPISNRRTVDNIEASLIKHLDAVLENSRTARRRSFLDITKKNQ